MFGWISFCGARGGEGKSVGKVFPNQIGHGVSKRVQPEPGWSTLLMMVATRELFLNYVRPWRLSSCARARKGFFCGAASTIVVRLIVRRFSGVVRCEKSQIYRENGVGDDMGAGFCVGTFLPNLHQPFGELSMWLSWLFMEVNDGE